MRRAHSRVAMGMSASPYEVLHVVEKLYKREKKFIIQSQGWRTDESSDNWHVKPPQRHGRWSQSMRQTLNWRWIMQFGEHWGGAFPDPYHLTYINLYPYHQALCACTGNVSKHKSTTRHASPCLWFKLNPRICLWKKFVASQRLKGIQAQNDSDLQLQKAQKAGTTLPFDPQWVARHQCSGAKCQAFWGIRLPVGCRSSNKGTKRGRERERSGAIYICLGSGFRWWRHVQWIASLGINGYFHRSGACRLLSVYGGVGLHS